MLCGIFQMNQALSAPKLQEKPNCQVFSLFRAICNADYARLGFKNMRGRKSEFIHTWYPISGPQLCEHSDHGEIIHSNLMLSRAAPLNAVTFSKSSASGMALKSVNGASFSIVSTSMPNRMPLCFNACRPFEWLKLWNGHRNYTTNDNRKRKKIDRPPTEIETID